MKGIAQERLVGLKKKLQREDIRLWDGYDFLGAEFMVDSIIRRANYENNIKVKIINHIENLKDILEKATGTKVIYLFYLKKPFYESDRNLCYGIQISKTEDINMMI